MTNPVSNPDPRNLPEGTRVRISYEGRIAASSHLSPEWVNIVRDGSPWVEKITPGLTVEIIAPPEWIPGVILTAGGAWWVIRKSNPRDSYRAMPVDLSGKLRTISIEAFCVRYPRAKLRFSPADVPPRNATEKAEPEKAKPAEEAPLAADDVKMSFEAAALPYHAARFSDLRDALDPKKSG